MSDIKNETAAILRDAISEARKEKIKKIWEKYKKKIIFTLISLVAIASVLIIFEIYKKSKEEEYSALFQKAVMEAVKGNNEAALEIVKNIYNDENAPANVRAMASFKYGAMILERGKFDEAIKVFLSINKLKKVDPYVRELSGLTALKALVDINDNRYDDQIRSLAISLENNSKILRYFILEQKAVFEWNRGNYKIAHEIFHELESSKDPVMDESVRKRSIDMVGIYNSKYASDEERKAFVEDESKQKVGSKTDNKSDKEPDKK